MSISKCYNMKDLKHFKINNYCIFFLKPYFEISKYCGIFFTPYLLRNKFGINNNKEKSN